MDILYIVLKILGCYVLAYIVFRLFCGWIMNNPPEGTDDEGNTAGLTFLMPVMLMILLASMLQKKLYDNAWRFGLPKLPEKENDDFFP
jgi:hypothetical protein